MERYFQDKAMEKGKRDRTRAVLIDSVIDVAWEKGASQTTVQDITKRSGLAQGTLYNHFDGIEELVVSAEIEVALEFEQRIAQSMDDLEPGIDRLAKAAKAVIETALENERHGALFVEAIQNMDNLPEVYKIHLKEDLDACRKAGHTKLAYSELLSNQFGALVAVAISRQLRSKQSAEINQCTCEALLRLCGVPPSKAATVTARAFA